MSIRTAAQIVLPAMLLGSLGCASSRPDPGRRNAELDRLEKQAGMPDSYRDQGLKEARAFLAARNRAPPPFGGDRPVPAAERHAGERIE